MKDAAWTTRGIQGVPEDTAERRRGLPSMSGGELSMRPGHVLGLSPGGFHRLAYVAWGARGQVEQRPLICVHGLTRNGRDFDRLAVALSAERPVICPDVVGRGLSDWLEDPTGYGYGQYCADMTALIARLDVEEVDWVGTSMGGLIGMMLAARPNSPIRRLVLNDVGPLVPAAALRRLSGYVGKDPIFDDLVGLEAYLRKIHATFGTLDDAAWRHLAAHSHRRLPDGRLGLAYDPAIGQGLAAAASMDIDLSALWQAVRCPVLVLRGADSDLLLAETARSMASKAKVVEISDVGHAPSLMVPAQIDLVHSWLSDN
jgi:pimeloyl-ACP methyl ester carboxylesterase